MRSFVKSKIEGVVAPCQEVRVDEQIDHVTEKRTNKLDSYITFMYKDEMAQRRWDLLKYIQSYDASFPYKASLTRQGQEPLGVKPCCLLPQCDLRDGKCTAHDKALVQWRTDRKTHRSEDQPLPPWKAQRVNREAEALSYRMRAEGERLCKNYCKRWKKGSCNKKEADCIDKHEGRPNCRSSRDSGWVCELDPCPYAAHTEKAAE